MGRTYLDKWYSDGAPSGVWIMGRESGKGRREEKKARRTKAETQSWIFPS
jgi:hypothetical protein